MDPSPIGHSQGSGNLSVMLDFYMPSPGLWAGLCSLAQSRRVPELESLFCILSFCFEHIGQQKATEPFEGLVLVSGAEQWRQATLKALNMRETDLSCMELL